MNVADGSKEVIEATNTYHKRGFPPPKQSRYLGQMSNCSKIVLFIDKIFNPKLASGGNSLGLSVKGSW